ncbi:diaminopropionate ammonia-lyase [Brevibacterium luteolum]|uniref:diaminopropionate ammonia-lyase n=1 Tax=Brevibacterium luteolum TaxID=199591 RepID=UPI001C248FFD|nr:diaminopropionate ammonia-lyase [Brevibacterium luteolum]MBU8579989.1 diaminopropionate ammonia-lyase [Brevibacterium luteolum]
MSTRRLVVNPFAAPEAVAPPAGAGAVVPRTFHQALPGYEPTPLRSLPSAAEALGVRAVWLKDESTRIGTPSFKILGASWATCRVLADWLGVEIAEAAEFALLRAKVAAAVEQTGSRPTLAAATDGNHGRAVAIMARLLGLPAQIFVPADMVAERIAAIESEGAAVEVVDGDYDDAIRRSAEAASDDVLVVSDTSWEGYTEPPAWVIDGYSTMMAEVHEAIAAGEADEPTVIAAQIGVGAFAAAVVRGFTHPGGPRLIGVEPTVADCVTVSIERGELTEIPGPQTSIMAGLNCGTPSPIAWPDMMTGFDSFATVTDDDAREAMRLLARDGVVSGESGAAGLAGLLAHREALGLSDDDVVLVFSTEGATDQAAYEKIIGA